MAYLDYPGLQRYHGKVQGEIDELKDDSILFRDQITSAQYQSIASVVQVGTYNIGSNSPSDKPEGVIDGTLLIIRNSLNWNMQIIFPYATSSANGLVAYYRLVNRNNYSKLIDWTKFISIPSITENLTSRFYGKKLSIIGDSIDTFDQTGYKISGYAMYYPALGVTSVEQTWWKKVINASGMSIEVNASYSGSRATNTDPSKPDFYDRVSVIGNPDTIFVTLGTNDSNNNVALGDYDFTTTYTSLSESTFRTAYIKGVKALQATYPDAQIVCITEKMQSAYRDSIAYIAKTLGVMYVDASDYIAESGNHPGEIGMRQIASAVLCPTIQFDDMDAIIEDDCLKKSQTCERSDLVYGVLASGEINPARTDRICTQTYYKVSKGDVIVMVSDAVFMAITEYDTNKTFLRSSDKYYSKVYKNATTNYRPFVAPQDGYVRMHFISSASTAPTFDAVIGSFKIISQTDLYNYIALDEYNGNCPIQSRKPIKLDSSLICAQDGTFINGKLWSFDDGHNVVGNISVIDVDAETATTRTHNLGHANSVDYNPNNDYLMMYGANGKNQPTIVLYKNPDSKTDLRKSDSNCTIIGLYNSSSFLNCSASVCWGESDCIAYYMTGVYVDGDQTIAPTREIYKLLLGMGNNNLSTNGGFGTYVSGKADDEYNGTAKILKIYTGEIPYLYINYGSGSGNLDTPQGMTYDKYVYVAWGFLGHNVLKIALNDDANTYKVVDNYFVNVMNNQGVASFYEPEMVALDGEYMYTGSRLSGNELFLKIRA